MIDDGYDGVEVLHRTKELIFLRRLTHRDRYDAGSAGALCAGEITTDRLKLCLLSVEFFRHFQRNVTILTIIATLIRYRRFLSYLGRYNATVVSSRREVGTTGFALGLERFVVGISRDRLRGL